MKRSTAVTLRLARAAVISALYIALSFVAPAFGPVQFRLSEALTVLPLIFPEAIVGVTLGCFLANMIGSVWIDALLGSATTLVAAVATWLCGKLLRNSAARIATGVVPPILFNAAIIPFDLVLCGFDDGMTYWMMFGTIAAGQCICILALGVPLCFAADRIFRHRRSAPKTPSVPVAELPRPAAGTPEKDTHSSES